MNEEQKRKVYLSLFPDHRHMTKYLRPMFGDPSSDDVCTVLGVLGYSVNQASYLCGQGITPKNVKNWKTGKTHIPIRHFAALVCCSNKPELSNWLEEHYGSQWWKNDFQVFYNAEKTIRYLFVNCDSVEFEKLIKEGGTHKNRPYFVEMAS